MSRSPGYISKPRIVADSKLWLGKVGSYTEIRDTKTCISHFHSNVMRNATVLRHLFL